MVFQIRGSPFGGKTEGGVHLLCSAINHQRGVLSAATLDSTLGQMSINGSLGGLQH